MGYSKVKKKVIEFTYHIASYVHARFFCNICGRRVFKFIPYANQNNSISMHVDLLMSGSDTKNFKCPSCGSIDRERHLLLYIESLGLFNNRKICSVLHFAPEKHFSKFIESLNPDKYIKCDYNPKSPDIVKMDITNMQFDGNQFDLVIANHVLEHVFDFRKALKEIFRVTKKGGICILQTPHTRLLKNSIDDPGINNDQLRMFFYGETDHRALFSEGYLIESLEKVGFEVTVYENNINSNRYADFECGVNPNETFFLIKKP